MAQDWKCRRRWIGAVSLLGALALLVLGQTALESKLQGMTFLLYWSLCLAATGVAVITALLDVRTLQHRARREQRDLLETALQDVQSGTDQSARTAGCSVKPTSPGNSSGG